MTKTQTSLKSLQHDVPKWLSLFVSQTGSDRDSLCQTISEDLQRMIDDNDKANKSTDKPSDPFDMSANIELSFRSYFVSLLSREDQSGVDDLAYDAICFAFQIVSSLARRNSASTLARLPCLLIEDYFSCVTIRKAEAFWSRIEKLTDFIVRPEIFGKSKILFDMGSNEFNLCALRSIVVAKNLQFFASETVEDIQR